MAEVVYNFRSPVWVWTYASGPDAGVTRFHSPQRFCIDDRTPLVLRQANGRAQNRAWVSSNPAAFVRHERGDDKLPTIVDAHGVIVRNGWSKSTWQYAVSGDEETYVPYHRGERVWIDQSLRPARTAHSNRIGVISVDSLECFSIPSSYVCFVPQLVRDANTTWPTYATPAGPVHSEIWEGQARSIQAYFEWPAGSPGGATCRWDTWRENPGGSPESRALDAFDTIRGVKERNRLFRLHWNIMTEALGQSCTARGCVPPTVVVKRERLKHEAGYNKPLKADRTRSFPPNARLNTILSAGLDEKDTVNQSNCCNIAPNCDIWKWEVRHGLDRLVRLGNVSHYHVLSEDLEHCPQGAAHKGHCVLLDDKTRCIYVGNPVQHTCCISPVALSGHFDDEETIDGIVLKTEREHEDEDSEEEKHGFAMVKVSPSSSSQEIQMPSSFEECTAPFMPQTPSPNLSEPCSIPKGVSFDSPYINSVYPSPPLSTTVDGLFDLSKTLPGSPSSRCEPYHQQRQKRKLQSERQRHHSRRKAQSQQRFLAQQSSTMMPGYTLLPTSSSVVSNLWSSSQYWPDSTRTTGTSLHPSEPVCSETLPISNGWGLQMGSALPPPPPPPPPTFPLTGAPTLDLQLCFCPNCQSHTTNPSVSDEMLLPACPFNCGFRVGQTLFHEPNCPYWPPYKSSTARHLL